jgi:hypothetical protein
MLEPHSLIRVFNASSRQSQAKIAMAQRRLTNLSEATVGQGDISV